MTIGGDEWQGCRPMIMDGGAELDGH